MPKGFRSNRNSPLSPKIRVGVLLGGTSSERLISICSGRAVCRALKRLGHQVFPIDPKRRGWILSLSKVDCVFNVLHGVGGEDGQIQKVLKKRKILFTGSEVIPSQRSFDKVISKRFFLSHRIPTPKYCVINRQNWKRKASAFPTPFFVKPIAEGSSKGVFLVEDFRKNAEKLIQGLRRYGSLILEERIAGKELTVGVLGSQTLPVLEVKPSRKFYDYRAKYTAGMTRYEVPAKIKASLSKRLKSIALKTHRSMKLDDFSRVDFMLDSKDQPYVLEVNSIPGLTELSLLPKAAEVAGISFDELCSIVLKRTLHKLKKRN